MIEVIMMANLIAQYEEEADRRFHEELIKASPAEAKIMLKERERQRQERIIENRHRESIRALERIEQAIQNRSYHL